MGAIFQANQGRWISYDNNAQFQAKLGFFPDERSSMSDRCKSPLTIFGRPKHVATHCCFGAHTLGGHSFFQFNSNFLQIDSCFLPVCMMTRTCRGLPFKHATMVRQGQTHCLGFFSRPVVLLSLSFVFRQMTECLSRHLTE